MVCTFQRCTPFSIRIRPAQQNNEYEESEDAKDMRGYVEIQLLRDKAVFAFRKPGDKKIKLRYGKSTDERGGLEAGKRVSYWLSYNRNQRILKYGKGYIMEETTLLTEQFPFPQKKSQDPWDFIFRPDTYKEIVVKELKCKTEMGAFKSLLKCFPFDRGLKRVEPQNAIKLKLHDSLLPQTQKTVVLYPQPLTYNWPPLVLESSSASLVKLSDNKYMLSANLPPTCRELYQNVISANVALDWPHSTPKLSDAIDYSIRTKGKILHEKLKEKDHGNGMSYLRITLGCHRGSSPGIPYVLEIWPPKSQSPIHNHGSAYAVIKVLHGSIKVINYNKTWKDEANQEELSSFTASIGDITWMSPNWFQTHKLKNESEDQFCATIQCYKYGDSDDIQWPYFNFLDGESVEDFLPNSDFDFEKLRNDLLKEYNADHRVARWRRKETQGRTRDSKIHKTNH